MTLQQLEYIIAVEETGNFTKAAERCCITQPSLSSMIQKLEDELSVKIFDRKQTPITPTSIGQIILKKAHALLADAAHLSECVEEEQKSLKGELKLGIIPTIAPYLVPLFMQHMLDNYPELSLNISEMKTADIKEGLKHGTLDAGIVAELNDMEHYQKDSLYYEEFYCYVSRQDELFKNQHIKLSELRNKPLWLLEDGHCLKSQMIQFCKLSPSKTSCQPYHLGNINTFMRIIEKGFGITFIPELIKGELTEAQQELIRPFTVPTPIRHIVFITEPNFIRTTIKDKLIEEIKNVVPHHMLTPKISQQLIL